MTNNGLANLIAPYIILHVDMMLLWCSDLIIDFSEHRSVA